MSVARSELRSLEPGTSGWTASDLDDPQVARQWDAGRLGRIQVAPLLVIESVSSGHERHDRLTKRRFYAEFGIPNYWIVDVLRGSLDCLVLDGDHYRDDVAGRGSDVVRPSAFEGFEIPLGPLWRS